MQETFGSRPNLTGFRHVSTFEKDGVEVILQHMFFQQGGRYCCLTLTCPDWNMQESRMFFSELLSKLEPR